MLMRSLKSEFMKNLFNILITNGIEELNVELKITSNLKHSNKKKLTPSFKLYIELYATYTHHSRATTIILYTCSAER